MHQRTLQTFETFPKGTRTTLPIDLSHNGGPKQYSVSAKNSFLCLIVFVLESQNGKKYCMATVKNIPKLNRSMSKMLS